MHASSCGGSAETEHTAVAVSPARRPSWAVVISVTPEASWRMPWMKICGVTMITAVCLSARGCHWRHADASTGSRARKRLPRPQRR